MKFASLLFLFSQLALADSLLINGAGATFPYPVYSKWFSEYRNVDKSIKINYQGIGSGGGIRQLLRGTVDFGASDAPMKDKETKKAKMPVAHIPTVLGAVTISYNLDLEKPLKLDGALVADLFLGKIKKWNDPKIAKLNPGVKLPDVNVLIAHRSDGSGTTAVFTDYMVKVSPEWADKVGKGKAIKWPTGVGAKGNQGVTGLIKNTPGAVGYIELTYALSNKLPLAMIKNPNGDFVTPSAESVSLAAAGVDEQMVKNDFKLSITNSPSKGAYPISSFTWLLVYEKMDSKKGKKIKDMLNWVIGQDAQVMAKELHYAPLPKSLVKLVSKRIEGIRVQ